MTWFSGPLLSQQPLHGLRPVPKLGDVQVVPASSQHPAPVTPLRWRKVTLTTTPPAAEPEHTETAAPRARDAVQSAVALAPIDGASTQAQGSRRSEELLRPLQRHNHAGLPIRQVAFQDVDADDSTLQIPPSLQPLDPQDRNLDIFQDPFQDETLPPPIRDPRRSFPQVPRNRAPGEPATDVEPGAEAQVIPEVVRPLPSEQVEPDGIDPASPYDRGEMKRESEPGDDRSDQPLRLDAPEESTPFLSPFAPPNDSSSAQQPAEATEIVPRRPDRFSCDVFRSAMEARTIDRISLDISPTFRPDLLETDEVERERHKFKEKQAIRQWRSMDGYVMATGRLSDLSYEKVVIEAEHGGTEEIPLNRISEADLTYINEAWRLPLECRIRQETFQPRQWTPSQIAWKASGLAHKPLYFQEVNLERYGHTAGPVLQPFLSAAHFFVNIAVLPYKMGIHPPTECQYTLGYYRPGSCAPWIVPPVPLSLRGAVVQGATISGLIALIP